MCIKLEKVTKFDSKIIDFIERHPFAYNIKTNNISNDISSDDIYRQYHIKLSGKLVGFFILVDRWFEYGEGFELEFGVLEEEQGKGIASECINTFYKYIPDWGNMKEDHYYLYAIVKNTNKNKGIHKLLRKCDFRTDDGIIPSQINSDLPGVLYKKKLRS